jgi:polyisoprenoid-binding protein YceI
LLPQAANQSSRHPEEETMIRKLIIGVALLAVPALSQAAEYEIDPGHSSVGFGVKHMMVSTVKGQFGKVAGTAAWAKPDYSDAKVDVTVDAASIDTRDAKRDGHLKSPDFFDVAKYPTLTFKSKKVTKGKEGHLTLTGDLTIHGVTKEVAFDVAGPTPEVKDPWGNTRTGVEATAKIKRKDFGLTWNKALEAGGVVVGDDVNIDLSLELTKKVSAPTKAAAAAPAKAVKAEAAKAEK